MTLTMKKPVARAGIILAGACCLLAYAALILVVRSPSDEKECRIPVLRQWEDQRREVVFRSKLLLLNHFAPPFDQLRALMFENAPVPEGTLSSEIQYYRKVTGLFPDAASGHGLLGYSYLMSGKMPEAREAFEQAYLIDSKYFWYAYDLGVIAFRQREFRTAVHYLHEALETDAGATVNKARRELLYRQVFWPSLNPDAYPWEKVLKQGYRDAYVMLARSYRALGQEELARSVMAKVRTVFGLADDELIIHAAFPLRVF